MNTGLVTKGVSLLELSPEYQADQLVILAGLDGGLFRSTNGGTSWSQVLDGEILFKAVGFYQREIA